MPGKKKKFNARFPAGRIKKIMQMDEEVGKVAQPVPVIISRTLELFAASLLEKAMEITSAKHAKTLTPSHMKQCILSDQRFDFLKELVNAIPDSTVGEDDFAGASSTVFPMAVSERRKSTCSSVLDDTVIKIEPNVKQEPSVVPHQSIENISMVQINPNLYKLPTSDQNVTNSALQQDTLIESSVPCSTIRFTPNIYCKTMLEEERKPSMKPCTTTVPLQKLQAIAESSANCKTSRYNQNTDRMDTSQNPQTITQTPVHCSTIRFTPHFYPKNVPPERVSTTSVLTTEDAAPLANYPNLRFCPSFYPEDVAVQHNSYSDSLPEQKSSIPNSSTHGHTRIAPLTRDDDYDT